MGMFKEIVDFIKELYNNPEGFIPLHAPLFAGNEKKYLIECIDTTFVSSVGRFVDKFEVEIANYTGSRKAVACVNGTNALYLALKLVGVKVDDEVITQPLTFVATANAISYCGAHPVFLDVDENTLGLSPEKLESWLKQNVILRKTKQYDPKSVTSNLTNADLKANPYNRHTGRQISACVPMHTYGHPCRIDMISEICANYNIPVVEDAAESLGSFYMNRHTGTFGTVGVLSFNGNKILTTGGGGMLLFYDEELAKRAKHLTTQAKTPHPWEFNHDETGYNYRMPNINAALGLAQLEQLNSFIISKRAIAESYKSFFKDLEVKFIEEPANSRSNYWLNTILFKNSEESKEFIQYSNNNNVMARPAWTLMTKLPMFNKCQSDGLEVSQSFSSRLINIPSSCK
jgi:perosamine synthetase